MRQDRDDPDDAMTPMAIAAKSGQKALFDLFLKWNDGQLVTTKVKIAQLYFLMEEKKVEEETEDRMAAFTDLLFSISEKEKKKVIRLDIVYTYAYRLQIFGHFAVIQE